MKNLRNFISKLFNTKPAQVQGAKSVSSTSSPIVYHSRVNRVKVYELLIHQYTKEVLEQIKAKLEFDYKIAREQERSISPPFTERHQEAMKQLNIIAENLNKVNIELKNRKELYESALTSIENDLQIGRAHV